MESPKSLSGNYHRSVLSSPVSRVLVSKRKADITPSGNARKKASAPAPASDDGDFLVNLQATLDSVVAGQTALVDRFARVEDLLSAVAALATSIESVKEALEECKR